MTGGGSAILPAPALPPGTGRCRPSRESPAAPARSPAVPRGGGGPALARPGPRSVRPGPAMASDSDTEEFYDAPEDVHLAAASPTP